MKELKKYDLIGANYDNLTCSNDEEHLLSQYQDDDEPQKGTKENPYTIFEYINMLNSDQWTGGYVEGLDYVDKNEFSLASDYNYDSSDMTLRVYLRNDEPTRPDYSSIENMFASVFSFMNASTYNPFAGINLSDDNSHATEDPNASSNNTRNTLTTYSRVSCFNGLVLHANITELSHSIVAELNLEFTSRNLDKFQIFECFKNSNGDITKHLLYSHNGTVTNLYKKQPIGSAGCYKENHTSLYITLENDYTSNVIMTIF